MIPIFVINTHDQFMRLTLFLPCLIILDLLRSIPLLFILIFNRDQLLRAIGEFEEKEGEHIYNQL
jgi:hypothetical protein